MKTKVINSPIIQVNKVNVDKRFSFVKDDKQKLNATIYF